MSVDIHIAESVLDTAIRTAANAHFGQRDKAGAPYILHPLRVMFAMQTTEERVVAVLHDVVEDCPWWTFAKLYDEGINGELIFALDTITRRNPEPYGAYLERVLRSPLATRVKLADLADNANLARLPVPPTKADLDRQRRYQDAIRFLSGKSMEAPQ